MHHIRTKLAILLLLAAILPVLPSYYLVKGLFNRGIQIGLNERVEIALEEAAGISRQLYSNYKEETLNFAINFAKTDRTIEFVKKRDGRYPTISMGVDILGIGKIDIYDDNANLIASNTYKKELTYPEFHQNTITQLTDKMSPDYLETGDERRFISVSAPVISNKKLVGFMIITRVLEENFTRAVQDIFEVNRIFKSLGIFSEDLKRGFVLLYFVVYGPIAVLSISVGYFFSRKVTSPLLKLAKGTQIVADGDLDYRVKVSSKDEIGQLVTAFNKMIATIKEKQRIAKEDEAQRRRMEIEAQRKAKDLEMAELKARALQAENERKTIELEKARELEKAYQALEESYRHLRETQAQLVQSGKMASLGNLAAGVAHEINNPLGAINSAADVSMRAVEKINVALENNKASADIKSNKQFMNTLQILRENTQLIIMGSSRVVKIVRSLKTFARLDEAEFQKTDIHEGLESTLMLLQHELKNRITIEKDYGNIQPVSCYPNELNQVFMNLLANAAQAIEDKGIIYLRTFYKNTNVTIQIEDNGCGISKQNLAQIFDPGFTTKGVGVGTGLGLSISYNIIQKHKGEIKVNSKVGKGTTFTVILPLDLDEQIISSD